METNREICLDDVNITPESIVMAIDKLKEQSASGTDVKGATYEEKLKDAGLTTLEKRRERGDAIEAFKTIKGFNRVQIDKWFTFESDDARPTRSNTTVTNEGTKRRPHVMKGERARLEIRRNFYNVRVVNKWNAIPDWVKEKESVNSFKNAYDKWANHQTRQRDDDGHEMETES